MRKSDRNAPSAGERQDWHLPLAAEQWEAVAHSLEFSPQQSRIVELLLRGFKDKQIAAELHLGVPTIRTYLKRIFDRLGVSDRVELILRVFAVAREISEAPDCHPS